MQTAKWKLFRMIAGDRNLRQVSWIARWGIYKVFFVSKKRIVRGHSNGCQIPDLLNGELEYYPGNKKICPPSHPRYLPIIKVENVWSVNENQNDFVDGLSNGDETGYGNHADFLNGWEEKVLAGEVKVCILLIIHRKIMERWQ